MTDPRSKVNRIWGFDYLMNMLWYGMLSRRLHLREVEDFTEEYSERIPDTTLHDLLVKLSPEPLRRKLVKQVKEALRSHELPKTDFPVRIIAIDGKCASISKQPVGDFSQVSDSKGEPQYLNRVLRAITISNKLKLIIGQLQIKADTNEMGEVKNFIEDLIEDYGKTGLLEVISVDAGMTSQETGDFIVENQLNYIMALRNPKWKLYEYAKKILGERSTPDIETQERLNGKLITRRLYRSEVSGYSEWEHLAEIWRIHKETVNSKGTVTEEERYFVTSLEPVKLTDEEVLQAIRMHWGIENNGYWVLDTIFKEDDSPWCNKAFLFVSWLRILAYNVITRLRTRRLRKKDGRDRSWKSIMNQIYNVLLRSQYDVIKNREIPALN